jgi:hypothetical protein
MTDGVTATDDEREREECKVGRQRVEEEIEMAKRSTGSATGSLGKGDLVYP